MENKKIPFAVFVLQYIENMIEDYKEDGLDEFDVLDDLIRECPLCPLSKECNCSWISCKDGLKEYVESAE